LDYPQAILTNDTTTLTVLLPGAGGYYRGSRFDWSGHVWQAEVAGHTWFAPFRVPHDPEANDGAMGPAEEFGMGIAGLPGPLGYEEAIVGDTFLKVGVGVLERDTDGEYSFGRNYPIRRPGPWETKACPDAVECRQAVTLGEWGYAYVKRIELLASGAGFTVRHELRNTGARAWSQGHYSHNFFLLDHQPVGPDYELSFPFAVQAQRDVSGRLTLGEGSLRFDRPVPAAEAVFTELAGYEPTAAHNGVTIANRATGTAVEISGDLPVQRYHFFATDRTVCPEPFVLITLAPGETQEWINRYVLTVGTGLPQAS
jgi:hypothetical protein